MSTEVKVLHNTGSRGTKLTITRYWGGDGIGFCLQLTGIQENGEHGYVQLNANDIKELFPIQEYVLYANKLNGVEIEEKDEEDEEENNIIEEDNKQPFIEKRMYLYQCFTNKYSYYVIAEHPTQAKNMVEKMLNDENWGYSGNREVIEIKQIAKQIIPALNHKYFLSDDSNLLLKEKL